jgi:hypothetical protein
MAKAFGILMIVLGVWLGLEIFTNGMDSAFGGIFASGERSTTSEPAQSRMQQIRARVQEDIDAGAARDETGSDE